MLLCGHGTPVACSATVQLTATSPPLSRISIYWLQVVRLHAVLVNRSLRCNTPQVTPLSVLQQRAGELRSLAIKLLATALGGACGNILAYLLTYLEFQIPLPVLITHTKGKNLVAAIECMLKRSRSVNCKPCMQLSFVVNKS